jgi:hypothetical protein
MYEIFQGGKFRGDKSKNILAGSGSYAPRYTVDDMRVMFHLWRRNRKRDVFFPAKKTQDVRWAVVQDRPLKISTSSARPTTSGNIVGILSRIGARQSPNRPP